MKKAFYLYLFFVMASFSFIPKASALAADSSFTVSYKDSLISNKQNKVLYNSLAINNISKDTIVVNGYVALPAGWKSLTNVSYITIVVPPASIRSVNVNLIKQANIPAVWQQVKCVFWQANTSDSQKYTYNLKVEVEKGYRLEQTVQEITLTDKPEIVHLGVHIKNTGNVKDVYTLSWTNFSLNIDEKEKIAVEAGKDTVFYYPLKINNAQWNKLYKESIHLSITSAENNKSYVDYKINRPQSNLKQNQSAYNNIPITFEGSAMAFGDKVTYSYGGRGYFQFGEHSLGLYYRSKQFGAIQNIIQRNVFQVDYKYRQWRVQAGQTGLNDNFLAIGNGLKLTYFENDKKEFSIAGVIHDPKMSVYQSDGITAKARYQVGKQVVTNTVEYNSDKLTNTQSYVESNIVEVVKKDNLKIDVQAGAGVSEDPLAGRVVGLSYGYSFFYNLGKWDFTSNTDMHGANFPGYRRGLQMQAHVVDYKIGKGHIGAMFSSTEMKRNYFKDTLFNTDILSYNVRKYGMIGGYSDGRNTVNMAAGILKQRGMSLLFNTDQYYYTDANYDKKLDKTGESRLTVTSQNAYTNDISTLVTSNMATANIKFFGVSGAYVRMPSSNNEGNGKVTTRYIETFNGGPFVNFSLFNKTLRGMVKYQFYRTIKDNYTRTGVEGNITYNTLRTGTLVQLSGYMPLRDDNTLGGLPINQTRYGMLSVSQTLKVPVITHRKFYDLKVVVYYDANSNNVKDKNENSLKAINIGINDEILLTDMDGIVEYDNIKEGSYKLDLINANTEDLVPVDGSVQSLVVNNNTTYEVPFKKGRAINGNIKIITDTFSNTKYAARLIQVTAEDTTGKIFKTFTEDNGNFTMYVPEGIYTVSINESAYADTDFKPAKASYNIDLFAHENSYIVFEIRQKKRKVRYLGDN